MIYIFLFLFLLSFTFVISSTSFLTSTPLSPSTLFKNLQNHKIIPSNTWAIPNYWFVDSTITQSYLNISETSKLNSQLKRIHSKYNYNTFFFVINSMKSAYRSDTGIATFLEELSHYCFNNNENQKNKSIFIWFSIFDRQMRISTGKEVGKLWTDEHCDFILDSLISTMKKGEYFDAFSMLLNYWENIEYFYSWNYTFWRMWSYFPIWLFLVCWIVFIYTYLTRFVMTKSEEERLKNVREILKKWKDKNKALNTKEVFTETCIICWEPLVNSMMKEDKKENDDEQEEGEKECWEGNKRAMPLLECHNVSKEEVEMKEIDDIRKGRHKDENANTNDKKKDNHICKLECGHQFHHDCIEQWMLKAGKCPICREEIDKENDFSSKEEETSTQFFGPRLMRIQTTINPRLSRINYFYINNTFDWEGSQTCPSTFKSSYSGSSSSSFGGSSRSW